MSEPLKAKAVDFFRTAVGGFLKGRCSLHAAGLTYFTLLALVPVLCLLMVLAKTCGVDRFARAQINGAVDRFITQVEQGTRPHGDAPGKPEDPALREKRLAQRAVAERLRAFVNPLFDQIDRFDIRTFGWIGLGMLLWTVISSLGQIEVSMNDIWEVTVPRPLLRRCALYVFVACFAPIPAAMAVSLPVLRLVRRLVASVTSLAPYAKGAGELCVSLLDSRLFALSMTFLCATLALSFLLFVMPHRRVRVLPALIGGGTSVLLLWGWIRLCTAAQLGIGRTSAFYGSFASPMIVLAWIYMSWQIVLWGVCVSHACQKVTDAGADDRGPDAR